VEDDFSLKARDGEIGGPTDETPHERLNRNLIEMLQEVRVAMPGVQVLFGFLLAVPFQQRFQLADTFQRTVYFITLLFAAAATACFVAPTAYHRLMFRLRDKPALVKFGNRMVIAGLLCLAVAMNSAVLLVTDFLFKAPTQVITVLVLASVYAWLWFGVAILRRVRVYRVSPLPGLNGEEGDELRGRDRTSAEHVVVTRR
jgi:hypothetical protein